jgi:hypothetical protein
MVRYVALFYYSTGGDNWNARYFCDVLLSATGTMSLAFNAHRGLSAMKRAILSLGWTLVLK